MMKNVLLILLVAFAASGQPSMADGVDGYEDFILAAGNAEQEGVRLDHLKKLADACDRNGTVLPGLTGLIDFVVRWNSAEARLEFFSGEVLRTQDYDLGLDEGSPLYPIGAFYRARMLVWVTLEYSSIYPFPDKRDRCLGKARGLLELAARAFPKNRVIRMYLGEPIPPTQTYPVPDGAPHWAVWQREAMGRLTGVIEWWIDHRLRPNGEYGGGWGDDCEMWRHWTPVLIGYEHPKARWAQTYFSHRLLGQPHLAEGYYNRMTDVEHSAEDLADALTPMMFLKPDHPEWGKRAERLIELMESRWTGRNERGFLQFKSTYFNVNQVDLSPARACDTVYHPRAVQPALLLWQRTGDRRMTRLFGEWMKTWVDAAARAERGKPAGILPTAIHWPDGQVGGTGESWWQPGNYDTPLYDFPSAMSMMLNTLLLVHQMTEDETYLDPIRSMAAARLEWFDSGQPDAPVGTRMWCAAQLNQLAEVVAKYRFLTGDKRFDELLRRENLPYLQFRLAGELKPLEEAFQRLASLLRINFPAYTSEVRYTDRVFRFPILYEPGFMFEKGVDSPTTIERGVLSPGLNRLMLLYQTATGDPGDPLYYPLNAVRWKTEPGELAALVAEADRSLFKARVYDFGEVGRELKGELLLLKPGRYELTLIEEPSGKLVSKRWVELSEENRKFAISLPHQTECILVAERE